MPSNTTVAPAALLWVIMPCKLLRRIFSGWPRKPSLPPNSNITTWGSMIAEGRSVLRSASYLSVIPGAALAVTVLGVHLFSEGLGKALSENGVRAA